jgi:hypothetical protein
MFYLLISVYIKQKHCIQQQNAELEACVNRHKDKFTNTNNYVSYTTTGYSVKYYEMPRLHMFFGNQKFAKNNVYTFHHFYLHAQKDCYYII